MTSHPARPLRSIVLLLLLLPAVGCGQLHNFVREEPFFEGAPVIVESPTENLSVVTFNLKFGEESARALREFEAEPRLRDADVYLLQEVHEDAVRSMAHELGCAYVYYPFSRHRHGKLFGNAVLVRGEVLSHRRALFPFQSGTNGQRRGAAIVLCRVGDRTLTAVSAHTETAANGIDFRGAQMGNLAWEAAWERGPVVIGGDFNTLGCGDADVLRETMARYGFDDAAPDVGRTAKIFWFWRERLDFLFSRSLRTIDAAMFDTEASDHRPVLVTFDFPKRGGA